MFFYSKCTLKPGKEAALKRRHQWVFSGAIANIDKAAAEGDIVEIYSSKGEYLATGYLLTGSLAIKVLSFEKREIGMDFWKEKITKAYRTREITGITNDPNTNAYRLVYSEGDGLPGLIIDWFNGTAVLQAHSWGIYDAFPMITDTLKALYGEKLSAVYDKSAETMKLQAGGQSADITNSYIYGDKEDLVIKEMGHQFRVHPEGQKTGFFLDQRGNRMFAQFYARGKRVLNAFSYSGAFSVYALKGGAEMVHSVDSSRQAIEWAEENIILNDIDPARHKGIVDDVKKFIARSEETYNMMILDPPAFAKHHNVTHNALQAYIHINARAIEKISPDGILFTFSCSQAITREMFQSAVMSAALETGREIKILHRLSQGHDHPVSIYHPESEYLKGLILHVS